MTEIEQLLADQVKELKAERDALLELLLDQQGLLAKEHIATPAVTSTGKVPWYIRQRNLTKLFRVPKEEKEANAS